ncbi:hypothetical protein [Streptomyces sp. NPDC048644]|uniref:hypothetical protein n=1 Tax=Streptomyces sp. NPDC048644 TaxID=3365582 RepID=UPI003716621A
MAIAMLLSNVAFRPDVRIAQLLGLAVVVAVVVAALAIKKLTRLPAIPGVAVLGILVSTPFSPIGSSLAHLVESLDFLSLTVPVLVFVGLGIGKDMPVLKRIGWRIVPVALVSFAASFGAAAVIAQFTLNF